VVARSPLTALCALAASGAWAQERPVALVGGDLYTVAGPPIRGGTIVFHRGKIIALGATVEIPADAQREDVRGLRVVPGFVDAYSGLGLGEIRLSPASVDALEASGPVQPHLRVIDALSVDGRPVARARAGGVTTVHSVPSAGNLIGGASAVWRLRDGLLPEALLASEAALHAALGELPIGTYRSKKRAPMTRMGAAALLRMALTKAHDYDEKRRLFREGKIKQGRHKPPGRDLKSEVLVRVLHREIPVVLHADRVDDLLVAIRLADEFGFRLVLAGAAEAWKIAPLLAQKKIAVIVAPVRVPPDRMERQGTTLDNAALLARAGVEMAVGSASVYRVANLPFEAGFARANGLPADTALAAVTLTPARILGVADRVGSLEPGKYADLVVVRGDPFEPTSRLEKVYVGGELVDLAPWKKK
jgi:imidazolonepropionase-like amidohydrolase